MRHLFLIVLLLPGFAVGSAAALELPQGPVLLTVTGHIEHTNVGDEAHFDREMLLALPQRDTTTRTPWHDGIATFSGPLGRALLEAVGAEGEVLRITALNDYAASVPVQDLMEYDVILALSMNGEPLRVRNQGPLFVIYPFDEHPHLLNEQVMTRSVWQVNRIDVRLD